MRLTILCLLLLSLFAPLAGRAELSVVGLGESVSVLAKIDAEQERHSVIDQSELAFAQVFQADLEDFESFACAQADGYVYAGRGPPLGGDCGWGRTSSPRFRDFIQTKGDEGFEAWGVYANIPGAIAAQLRKNVGALASKVAPKGSRALPSTYLDAGYISRHLDQFYDEGVASRIVLKDSHIQFGVGKPDVGKTEFVSTKSDIDEILSRANGDINRIANELGVQASQLQGGLVRIDFQISPGGNKTFMPSGNEFGTNPEWLPGGILPNGKSEAIVKTEGMVEGVDYTVVDLNF